MYFDYMPGCFLPPHGLKEPYFCFYIFYKNFIFVFYFLRVGRKNGEVNAFQSQIGGNCDWNAFTFSSLIRFLIYKYSIAFFGKKVKYPPRFLSWRINFFKVSWRLLD